MFRLSDPLDDFHRLDREKAEWLKRLPTCEHCGDAIQQERAFCFDEFWYCDDCAEHHYRRDVIPNE